MSINDRPTDRTCRPWKAEFSEQSIVELDLQLWGATQQHLTQQRHSAVVAACIWRRSFPIGRTDKFLNWQLHNPATTTGGLQRGSLHIRVVWWVWKCIHGSLMSVRKWSANLEFFALFWGLFIKYVHKSYDVFLHAISIDNISCGIAHRKMPRGSQTVPFLWSTESLSCVS